jgi:hypothetical protein
MDGRSMGSRSSKLEDLLRRQAEHRTDEADCEEFPEPAAVVILAAVVTLRPGRTPTHNLREIVFWTLIWSYACFRNEIETCR